MVIGHVMTSDSVSAAGLFPKTPWSLIARARDSRKEFGELLAAYREPLLVFARVKLQVSTHDAEDAVGELYAALLAKDSPLQEVLPTRGKFRSWLATCLQNEVRSVWRANAAEKRGGGLATVSLEAGNEGAPLVVVDAADDPAAAFDRAFADALWSRVVAQFLAEVTAESLEGRVRRAPFDEAEESEMALADAFIVSRSGVTRARRAARARLRELLTAELSALVETPEELQEEIAWLMQALGQGGGPA